MKRERDRIFLSISFAFFFLTRPKEALQRKKCGKRKGKGKVNRCHTHFPRFSLRSAGKKCGQKAVKEIIKGKSPQSKRKGNFLSSIGSGITFISFAVLILDNILSALFTQQQVLQQQPCNTFRTEREDGKDMNAGRKR